MTRTIPTGSAYTGLRKICLLFALLFLIMPLTHAQQGVTEKTVTLVGQNMSLRSAFKSIRQQTGLHFQYNDQILNQKEKRSPNFQQAPLSKVMDFLLQGTDVIWKISENTILLKKNESTTQEPDTAPAGAPRPVIVTVTGKVRDASGDPIAGATVRVKGTTKGTTTDVEGNFSLDGIQQGNTLVFSTLGYETREVEVKAPTIFVGLNVDVRSLDETVIIAYGTTTKRFNTGNVSTVKAADIEKQPVSNPLQALQGRMPGMTITQQTGAPGGGFNVQIRGQNSLRADGNKPLYIIDGVPYASSLLTSIGNVIIGSGNPLNYINPADIESIDILKDADATSIYGSRGANGVVLITTKKGAAGKTKVDVNFYTGIGRVTRSVDLLNTPQYLSMRREALKNDNASPDPIFDADVTVWDTTRYTDWQKLLIGGSAKYTDVQASVSGGNDNVQYLVGAGYHKETTVFPGEFSDQKGSVHFNINSISTNRKFKFMISGNYIADHNNLSNYDFTSSIVEAPNTPEIYNPDGSINWANNTWVNPMAKLLVKFKNSTNNLVSNANVSYEIIPGLEIKTSMGYTNMLVNEITTNPIASISPAYGVTTGSSTFGDNSITSWIMEPQLQYTHALGHGTLTALLGMSIQQNKSEGLIQAATGITDDDLLESRKAASAISIFSETNIRYKYNAGFARLNYNWMGKYLFNITARRDGSSRFGPGKQFANFGALGVAWIFSEEDFIKRGLSVISFGKLRGSYGTTGNDQTTDYGFLSLYNSTQYPYGGSQGLYPNNLFNSDFAWEINKKLEFGLELGFLKDRLLINGSYYRNRSSNQLVGFNLPPSTGFNSVIANLPAVVQNTGVELLLDVNVVKSGAFNWRSSINLTIPKNKLVAYPGLENSSYASTFLIGEPLSIQRVYHCLGADPETGQYQFADSKGNPTTTPDYDLDRTVIINTAPKYYGGFQNSFQYKGFQLDVLFQVAKQTGRDYRKGSYPGAMGVNQPVTVLDRWQKPGDHASIQRFDPYYSLYQSFDYAYISDLSFSDASFIRLKNLSLTYQLPEGWKKRMRLQNCRLYLQGQNLITITKYKGIDPENQSFTSLPPLRVWTIGLQLSL